MALRKSSSQRSRFDRLSLVSVAIFLLVGAIILRLIKLQILDHGFYTALAEGQYAISEKLLPQRGEIFFRDIANPNELLPVATNREKRLVFAVPNQVKDPEPTAQKVATMLSLDPQVVLERLKKQNDKYEPLAHEVEVDLADKVEALRLPGIETSAEITRFYPFGDITAQISGFLGYKGDNRVGQYGLEGYFDKQLAGVVGHIGSDSTGLLSGQQTITEAKDGDSLLLTVDRTVQHTACQKLQDAVEKHGANGGEIIIVNPKTGAILAMCSVPSYDPNHYNDVTDSSIFTNGAIFKQYEPGSVMKAITLASALDRGLITPDSTFTDTGSVKIGKYTIRNSENKSYGVQTMNQVLEQSINTGAVFAADLLGQDKLRDYFQRFGFGEKTGITLQGENDGNISSLSKKGDIYPATASFGQGVTVTPLQLVMAYASLANNGILMKPRIVDAIVKPNGFHEAMSPEQVRQVIKPETARTIQAMLVNVVRNGHGKAAAISGYYVGGKTGTAQVPYGDRPGYDPNKNIGTFVGFAPMTDPAFVMLVKLDEPKDVKFAESTAVPLFGEVANFLLNYYKIPPDDLNVKK